jgi:hypothetical protein
MLAIHTFFDPTEENRKCSSNIYRSSHPTLISPLHVYKAFPRIIHAGSRLFTVCISHIRSNEKGYLEGARHIRHSRHPILIVHLTLW